MYAQFMKGTLFILALGAASISFGQKPQFLPNDLRAVYRMQQMHFRSGNVRSFFASYAPNYVSISPSGKKSNREELKTQVAEMMKGSAKRDLTITFTGVKVKGNTATVMYTALIDFTAKDGTVAHLKEVGTDTWVKGKGGWMETKTVDTFFGPAK